MKKNVLSNLFGCTLLLIGLFLLVACQPAAQEPTAVKLLEETGAVTAANSADRKFFNTGYGTSARTNTDMLSAADSADRKFFNAVSDSGDGAVVNVDPADRKFFNTTEGSIKTLLLPIPRH